MLGHSVLLGALRRPRCSLAYLWFVRPQSLAPLVGARPRPPRATARRLAVVAVLGFVLNDSGHHDPGHDGGVFEARS